MKPLQKQFNTYLKIIAIFLLISSATFAHFGQRSPLGGSVSCILAYDTLVYLGTNNGGVFFGTNSQLLAWSAKPVGLKSGKITALANTGKYMFAGTADSGVFIFNGYVGTDRYWRKINTGLRNLKITSLLAIDSITVLAGTSAGGIFKTTDKGATWAAANNLLAHTDITALAKAGNRVICTSDGGVWGTDDNGTSWIDLNDGSTKDVRASAISYNAASNEILIFNTNGLFLASSASNSTNPSFISAQTGLPSGTIVRSISNNGTSWFLATDKGVFTSPSGTISWISMNTNIPTMDINAVVPFQTSLIAGTNKEGIFKTSLIAMGPLTIWTANNIGYNNLETYSMLTSGVGLVVAATEKGVFVSNSVGVSASYVRANKGLTDSLHVTDITLFGTQLFVTTKNAGVFMSADTGKNWTAYNTGLTTMAYKKVFASASNLYILAANGIIYEYSTSMSHWMNIQNGLPANVIPTSLTFFGTTMILGTYGNGIYMKEASEGTWIASNTGLTNLNVTSVTSSANKIFAGTDGSGVFVSDPATVSWTATSPLSISHTSLMNLNGSKVQAMAYNAGYVFASYNGGLLATSDNGVTWIAGGNQFNLPSYTAVNKISFVSTRVFVTTENNGLYSNALSELPPITGINDKSGIGSTTQNFIVYPNPSNGNITIDLQNIKGKIIEIAIYDNVGRLVKHISNMAWQQTVSVNFPADIYFVRISTDHGTLSQKVIIN